MDITVISKARYEALLTQIKHIEDCLAFIQNQNADIKNLETQIAMANSQLKAIQDSNNQLAEIAFDENRFTQDLMDKVWENAERAARDVIDIDDIASEVANNLDVSEDVERAVNRLGCVTGDDINDKIEDFINDNCILNSSEIDDAIEQYVDNRDFIERDDVQEMIEDALDSFKDDIVREVIQAITNKLTAKENDHANNDRDDSLHISGTHTESQGASMLNAPAGS